MVSTVCWVSTAFNFACSFSFCILASWIKCSWVWRAAFNPLFSSCRTCKNTQKKSQMLLQFFYFMRKGSQESNCKLYNRYSINRPNVNIWSTGYRLEVPVTPSLGSINLLEEPTEPGETFYLLDHSFVINGYDSGIAR